MISLAILMLMIHANPPNPRLTVLLMHTPIKRDAPIPLHKTLQAEPLPTQLTPIRSRHGSQNALTDLTGPRVLPPSRLPRYNVVALEGRVARSFELAD